MCVQLIKQINSPSPLEYPQVFIHLHTQLFYSQTTRSGRKQFGVTTDVLNQSEDYIQLQN